VPAPRTYHLRCCGCGASFEDDGVRLDCAHPHPPALLRSEYAQTRHAPGTAPSVARYQRWLPLGRPIATDANVAVYRSAGLAAQLGLRDLWIAFSGWWPERGATMRTATFKELEAIAAFGRLEPDERRTLVVASAGNTAAAFAEVATAGALPVVIVIPLEAWEPLAALVQVGPSVRVVAVEDGTYDDAIALAKRIAALDGFVAEGGVRNVARRDGMGTIVLTAVDAIGALPDVYVQAVGSAAGALAAHEAALRLMRDGRFGDRAPRLMLSQNAPFTPIHDAWSVRAATLAEHGAAEARERQSRIAATVLGNPAPPYAAPGGIREALAASGGRTYAIGNDAMARAMLQFLELEGIDVEPPAGVAIAALAEAVRDGSIGRQEIVLLNVTGGGRARRPVVTARQRPPLVVDRTEIAAVGDVADRV
jgi:cysteate synthase